MVPSPDPTIRAEVDHPRCRFFLGDGSQGIVWQGLECFFLEREPCNVENGEALCYKILL